MATEVMLIGLFCLLISDFWLGLALRDKSANLKPINIKYSRPQVERDEDFQYRNLANDAESFMKLQRQVLLDACSANANTVLMDALEYAWEIKDALHLMIGVYQHVSKKCQLTWIAPYEGIYHVSVTLLVRNFGVAAGSRQVEVRDLWVVLLGDSYMAGEGNPDKEKNGTQDAVWIDEHCHRSSKSYGYLIYEQLKQKYVSYGILLTFLACSGAELSGGMLGRDSQVEVLQGLIARSNSACICEGCCKNVPDAICQAVGVNDMGFNKIIYGLLTGNHGQYLVDLPLKLDELNWWIGRLNATYMALGIPPENIFYVEYVGMLRNEKGEFDASCGLMNVGMSTKEAFAEIDREFAATLDLCIRNSCQEYGWNCIDVLNITRRHGICSQDPFFLKASESLEVQDDVLGSFHPNPKGHAAIADAIWEKIEKKFEIILNRFEEGQRLALSKRIWPTTPVTTESTTSRAKGSRIPSMAAHGYIAEGITGMTSMPVSSNFIILASVALFLFMR